MTMPNVGSVLRDEIRRLSRREIRRHTQPTKKATTQNRHHIAALNRKVAQLERQLALLARQAARQPQSSTSAFAAESTPSKIRFVAKGLRSHRNRLGLSARDFGKLVGVTANSVYAWESGATIPRSAQLARIAALRGVGKREAAKRLEAAGRAKSTKRPSRRRTT